MKSQSNFGCFILTAFLLASSSVHADSIGQDQRQLRTDSRGFDRAAASVARDEEAVTQDSYKLNSDQALWGVNSNQVRADQIQLDADTAALQNARSSMNQDWKNARSEEKKITDDGGRPHERPRLIPVPMADVKPQYQAQVLQEEKVAAQNGWGPVIIPRSDVNPVWLSQHVHEPRK